MIYTLKGLSATLGLPESEIKELVRSGIIADGCISGCISEGRFNLESSAREIIRYYRVEYESDNAANLQNERALLARVKRKNAEYDLGLRTKELHKTEDVEYLLTQMLVSFKSKLSAIPSKLAPQLSKVDDSVQVYDILKQAIDEAQMELADYDSLFSSEI